MGEQLSFIPLLKKDSTALNCANYNRSINTSKKSVRFLQCSCCCRVPRSLRNNCLALGVVTEWADMGIKRAATQLLLLIAIDDKKLFEELGMGSFSLEASVRHLGKLFDELADTRADFEWAAFFESGAVASETLALGNKDSIWAHGFAKSWTLEHHII